MRFKVGNRVKVDGYSAPGNIVEDLTCMYDKAIFIVKMDTGLRLKVSEDNLTLIPEETTENKPDTVTITRDEFITLVAKVTNPTHLADKLSLDSALLVGLSGAVICRELEKELFGEKVKND